MPANTIRPGSAFPGSIHPLKRVVFPITDRLGVAGGREVVESVTLVEDGDVKRRRGEIWLGRGDIEDPGEAVEPGSVVDLHNREGHYRGRGFYSSEGPVAVRVVSRSKTEIDRSWIEQRLHRALRLRQTMYPDRRSYRLVNAEGDYLPGLIVDKYGEHLVVQQRVQAMERFGELLLDLLEELVDPDSIYARNDNAYRRKEGLESYRGLVRGKELPDRVCVQERPYELYTDVKRGQKTGYYLDQEQNRRQLWTLADDRVTLDCFSYAGGWGLAALHGGARRVTFVDQDETALDLALENADRNGWSSRVRTVEEDVFDYLTEVDEGESEYDLVVLDPPAFARGEDRLESARRGYKEINRRAMRLLKPRGLLATSSCSAPVDMTTFSELVGASAHDAHVTGRYLQRRYQSPDHPWLIGLPRTLYLKCLICEIALT